MNLVSDYEDRLKKLKKFPEKQMEFMMDAAPFLAQYYAEGTNKKEVFQEYMRVIHGVTTEIQINNDCKNCGTSFLDIQKHNGSYVCHKCGLCQDEKILDEPSYKDEIEMQTVGVYSYKRQNHFSEWLAQYQGLESTPIQQSLLDKIHSELQRQKLDVQKLDKDKMRVILKKLKLSKYYEHIPSILCRITGKSPPKMSGALEEKLRLMFAEIQEPFNRHCPPSRKNFLSYSYVLYKFCELLGEDEFMENFSLLKSKEKLKACDDIWKNICRDLRFEFIPTI